MYYTDQPHPLWERILKYAGNLKLKFVLNIDPVGYLLWHYLICFGAKNNKNNRKIHTTIMVKLNKGYIYIIVPRFLCK